MGNKAPISLTKGEWVNLNDEVEGGLVEGTTYVLQANNLITVFAGEEPPVGSKAGFRIYANEKFAYTAASDTLFVKTAYRSTYLNIAD